MTNISGKSKLLLIDSDAIIGLINEEDELHSRCLKIGEYLSKNGFIVTAPYAIVLEAATALAKDKTIRRPDLAAQVLINYAKHGQNFIEEHVVEETANIYDPKTSKQNSPFDHYLSAVAKVNNIDIIFSFDKFYKKQGLTLAEELLN